MSDNGNVVRTTNTAGQNIQALDTKLGELPSNKTVAQVISEAVSGGTANVVTHSGAVGNATTPIFVTEQGVATAGTALATVATSGSYADLSNTPSLGTAAALDSTTTIAEGGAGLPTAGTVYTALAGKQDTIPANTYDAYGAADTAEQNAKDYADGLDTAMDTRVDALEATSQNLSNTYQAKSASTVADGTYNYISQGNGVATNLVALDTRAKANADAIATKANSADLGTAAALDSTTTIAEGGAGLPTAGTVYTALAGKQDTIPANTYDAYGAADTAEQNAKDYADGLDTAMDTRVDALEATSQNLSNTYQAKSASTVADGTYNYISQGNGVATNLVALDTRAKANADAIATKANSADLATVATSGAYSDLSGKPTVDQTYDGTSANAQSGTAVAGAIANMQTTTNLSGSISGDTGSTTKYPSVAAVEAAISAADGAMDTRVDALEDAVNDATTGLATKVQSVTKTGTGNLLTNVATDANGAVTITVNGTALVDPATSNENGVYVLTATTSDGTATYAWEQIARATGE